MAEQQTYSYDDDPTLSAPAGSPAAQAATPSTTDSSPLSYSYETDPSLNKTATPDQSWGESIRSGLMSLVPGMSSGGWGPQNWQPAAYGASDAAVHGATLGLSDIARGAVGDLYGGPSMADVKAQRDQYATEHPYANLASNLAGGIATAPILPGGALFKAASEIANPIARYAATVGAGGLLGAGFGAAGGAIDEAPTGDWSNIGQGAETGAKFGGVLGAAVPAVATPLAAGYRYLAGKEWLPAWTTSERQTRTGQQMQRDFTDPQSTLDQGQLPPNPAPANQPVPSPPEAAPTTAQLTGDVGATGMQNDLVAGIAARPENTWSPAERELVQKAQAQGEARTAYLQGEAPVGTDPNDIKMAVQQHLDDIGQQNQAILGQTMTPERGGEDARAMVTAAETKQKQDAHDLYSAITPGDTQIDTRPIALDAQQIERERSVLAKPPDPQSEESQIFQIAKVGTDVPFSDFTAFRGRLLDAIRIEREANGNTPSLRRMTQLRQSMDDTLGEAAANNLGDGAVARHQAAADAWRQVNEKFGDNAFVGPLLETRGTVGDFKVPDTNVGGKIITNNQSARAFLAAGGDAPALRGLLADDLNRSLKGKELTPQGLQTWRAKREGAIRAVPGFDAELDNLTTGARTGIIKRVADSGSDVPAQVSSILTGSPLSQTSRNSASEMMRLRGAVAGDPQAEAALKGAVINHISNVFVDPKTGDIKPGFLRFMQEKRGALEAAVGPDGMRVLDALVTDMQRPQVARPDAATTGRAAGAPTGLRAALQAMGQQPKMGIPAVVAVSGLTHALSTGVTTTLAVAGYIAKALQRHGIANQAELLTQAMNNPALARALLIKATDANASMIERGIAAAMAGTRAGAPAAYSYTGPQPPPRRRGNSGGGQNAASPFDAGAGGGTPDEGGEYTAAGTPPNAPTLTLGGEPAAGPAIARGGEGERRTSPWDTPLGMAATAPAELAYGLGNTLVAQPILEGGRLMRRVLSGEGFTPEEATGAAMTAMTGSIGQGGLGAGPRLRGKPITMAPSVEEAAAARAAVPVPEGVRPPGVAAEPPAPLGTKPLEGAAAAAAEAPAPVAAVPEDPRLGIGSNKPPPEPPPAKFPQYAEAYPDIIPGGKPAIDKNTGKEYTAKDLTPEAEAFAKERGRIQTDMNKNGYEPYFDPAKRSYVDPANYPGANVDTRTLGPSKPATIAKYADAIGAPETAKALRAAYDKGIDLGNADHWYAMAQLEKEYTGELGAKAGRAAFLDEFAAPMAATTSGNNPQANLLLAHYLEYTRKTGQPAPTAGYDLPSPIGGRRAAVNLRDYAGMRERGGYSGLSAGQPKMHDFSRSFIGDLSRPVIDDQMARGMLAHAPAKMADATRTTAYGALSEPVHALATELGLQPGNVQDVSWAGFKGEKGKPMISIINEAIERTHRLTGMAKKEIVRRGLVRKEIPLYGLTGVIGAGAAGEYGDR